MNKQLEDFLTYKTLGVKLANPALYRDVSDDVNNILEKNLCTKITQQLSDRIDETVRLLDMHKRNFVEMAIIQALDDADSIILEILRPNDDSDNGEQS